MIRIRCTAAGLAACATIAAVGASAAAAKTVTMHFFSKQVYFRTSDASGKPLHGAPGPGDRLSYADNFYAGNHKHHARRATASDHVDCTITSGASGLCDGAIAIGGSMIIGDDFTFSFTSRVTVVKITGGAGRYRHAHGTVISKLVTTSTSDITIKVTT